MASSIQWWARWASVEKAVELYAFMGKTLC